MCFYVQSYRASGCGSLEEFDQGIIIFDTNASPHQPLESLDQREQHGHISAHALRTIDTPEDGVTYVRYFCFQ
jgi:hypothetical protein